jgi:hypothetical protein
MIARIRAFFLALWLVCFGKPPEPEDPAAKRHRRPW